MFIHMSNMFAVQLAVKHQQEMIKWFENEHLASQAFPEPTQGTGIIHKSKFLLKCWMASLRNRLTLQADGGCWQAAEECS